MHESTLPMTPAAKVVVALLMVFVVGLISGFMYLVTTFLFHFSSGQSHMGPVVDYGALAVIAFSLLTVAFVWRTRSLTAAAICAAVVTPVAWVVAVFVEWRFSFALGAG
jgi:hypothetical protein